MLQLSFGSMPSCYVWLGNMSPTVTEKSLVAKLRLYGTVTLSILARNQAAAFLGFESESAAAKVVTDMKGRTLGGSKLQVGGVTNTN